MDFPTISTKIACPRLLPVPSMIHELTIKASAAGITVLREGRFRKRYTGSRTAEIDINGKLYLKRSEYVKAIQGNDPGTKKRSPTKGTPNRSTLLTEIKESNVTDNNPQPTKRCEYRVNKVEVRNRIHGMINTGRGKKELYFWTVTFPKGIADDLAYRAFNTWLTTLRQKKFLRNYLWIAERQENGTIHFHIAIPHKMSVVLANRSMRVILSSFAKRGELALTIHQVKRYNGVDISKNRKSGRVTNFAIKKGARSLANYLTKYVTKNDTPFSHLAWHNSRGFSALFTGVTFTVGEFYRGGFVAMVRRKSVIANEFFMFFPWVGDPPALIMSHLYELNSFIQEETGES